MPCWFCHGTGSMSTPTWGSTKTRNVERRNVESWNRKPGTPEQKTRNVERWNRKHGTLERWNRKPGTPEQKTRNVERWKRKHGTLEQKTRNAFVNFFLMS